MNKKLIPGLVAAIVAIGFAAFVTVSNVTNKSTDEQVKAASTSQVTKKSDSTSNSEQSNDESTSNSTSTPGNDSASNGQSSGSVLAIVTKPAGGIIIPSPVTTTAVETSNSGDQANVTPSPTPTPTPAPTPSPTPTPTPAPTPTAAPVVVPGNLVGNPSVEENTAGQPNGWASSFYGAITATPSYSIPGRTGDHALNMTVSGATTGSAGANGAQWNSPAFNVTAGTAYTVSDFYMSDVVTEVDITYIINGVATPYYGGVLDPSAVWKQSSITQTAPAGATQAYVSHILSTNGYVTTDDYLVSQGVSVGAGFAMPIVSLTFDDAWASIHANALPLLRSYGIHSTQYLLTGVFGLTGYMNEAQMADLATTEEVAAHTVDHCDLSGASHAGEEGYSANCSVGTIPQSEYDFQLGQNKATLTTITGQTVANFASPYGANAPVAQLQANGLTSQRGVSPGYNSPANFNQYNILVQNILSTTTPADVQGWIDSAISSHTWLVIVYHEVGTSEDTTYSTSTANLDANLAYLKSRVVANQVQALTVRDALAAIHSQGF